MWITLAKKFWPYLSIVLLIIVCLGQYKIYKNKEENLNLVIANLETQLLFTKQELFNCKSAIVAQNEKIEADAKQASDKLKQLEIIRDQIYSSQLKNEKTIDVLRKQKLSNNCVVIEKFLKDNIKDLR